MIDQIVDIPVHENTPNLESDQADNAAMTSPQPSRRRSKSQPKWRNRQRRAPRASSAALVSVAATTLKPSPRILADDLADQAHDAADQINVSVSQSDDAIEDKTRELIRQMLLVREEFETAAGFDWAAFENFADRRSGKVRGKVDNRWQRLAKVCTPLGTKRPLTSKYGYVLAALHDQKIGSATVLEEFKRKVPVEHGGPRRTGLERFVRLYKKQKRESQGGTKSNLFVRWSEERLVKTLYDLVDVLVSRDMVLDHIKNADDIVVPDFAM